MGDDNIREAAVVGVDDMPDAAQYEAAATLASLISASVSNDSADDTCAPTPLRLNDEPTFNEGKHVASHDNDSTTGTRKFTRNDDVNLIRGILKYGKASWKKIWQETPSLQHIKHSALKDRGRSKRFKNALSAAEQDPRLLDRPFELLGDENSHWYAKAAEPSAASIENSNSTCNADNGAITTFYLGRTHVNMGKETETKMESSSEPSTTYAGSAVKNKATAVVKNKDTGNEKHKPKKAATTVPKKPSHYNIKGLRTLSNNEVEEFPGWTVERVQRKKSNISERFWSHPNLDGVRVRSRVGMREMMQTMESKHVDPNTAYELLMNEGKGKYFIGSRKQA